MTGTSCRICGHAFASNLSRKRHEDKCTGQSWPCRYCHALLSNQRGLHNHEALCKKRAEDNDEDRRLQREREIQAKWEEQQMEQIRDDTVEESQDDVHPSHRCDQECVTCGTNHKKSQGYQCGQCRKHFGNIKMFQRHRQAHHARKAQKCMCYRCQSMFSTRAELASHLSTEHNLDVNTNKPILKCCDCNETFDAHYKLHTHRVKHTHARAARLDDPSVKMPWEKDPNIEPPWVAYDEFGNEVTDQAFRQIYSENRDTIQAPHDPGNVRGVYNFPLDDFNGETVIMRPHLDQILRHETHTFKINVAFGVILRNIETGEYRYFTAYYNNTILDRPYRISRDSDINDLLKELEESDLIEHIMKTRESTKWQKVYVTNLTYFVYRMGFLIGARRRTRGNYKVPDYIYHHNAIISLDTQQNTRQPYNDNLCAFRCLAWSEDGRRNLEKRTKTYYNTWRRYQEAQGVDDLPVNARRFKGIYFQDLPDFEKCFSVRTSVYTLHEDRTCSRVYHSSLPTETQTESELFLNLFEHHFSLINDFSKYAKKFACSFCRRAFDATNSLSRHEKSCSSRVTYKFPGGIYTPTLSIFDQLQQTLGVVVEPDLQFYPWFAVYDFESVLKGTDTHVEEENTDNTRWVTEHIPVSVSISSNVEGYRESRCFVDDDPDNLVKQMCDYLEEIQCRASTLGHLRWEVVNKKLQDLKNEFPVSEVTTESMTVFNSTHDMDNRQPHEQNRHEEEMEVDHDEEKEEEEVEREVELPVGEEEMEVEYAEGGESYEGVTQPSFTGVGSMDCYDARKLHAERVESLTQRFEKYISVLPVLGFNSSKYDLNLIKMYLPKHLRLTTECDYVIKKTNQYTAIVTSKFKFLDIVNYLAAGCSYSKFLKAYDIKESKSYFPYEWFDDVDKLNYDRLPPYETFYSKLKNDNVLQLEYSEWQAHGCKGSPPKNGHEKYEELLQIWHDKGMSRFEHFLEHYANLDTGPFVQAAEKLQKYYFDMKVDVFKIAISAPGVARRLLFKHAKANNKYFASFGPEHEDLFYKLKKCAFGGPSIIFKRYAKVDETYIRNNPDKQCKSIAGYDCNGLYLWALGVELPVLFPIRRTEETNFKPEVSWRHLEMYQWMNWRMDEEGIHIQHKLNSGKEFPVGPYKLDGFAASNDNGRNPRGYEFHGCWTHGHDRSVCGFNRDKEGNPKTYVSEKTQQDQEKKRKATLERENYIKLRGIELIVIYECQFAQLKKENKDILHHSLHMFPDFYLRYPRQITVETILDNVENGALTGFVQVDIRVPEKWPEGKERDTSPYEHFSEMAPIFCNSVVHFNEWGPTMQKYSLSHLSGIFTDSRKLLIGGMSAEKIFLATNLLKWYLEQGLEVTRVYEVVEYRFEKCFEGFCDYISTARRAGDGDPTKEILGETCKVLGNASYGSLLLDKTKHSNVKYVQHSHEMHLAVNDPCFKSACSLPGGMYEIETSKKKIDLDIPIQLAFTILQSAKLKLLEFYYDCLDYYIDRQDFELTHTDTDSLYFAMSGACLDDVVKPSKKQEFERSIYGCCYDRDESGEPFRASSEHWFPRRCCESHKNYDKRERGLFKKEAEGTELIALAPKTYHLQRSNEPNCIKAKGLNKSALVNPRDLYMAALKDRRIGSATNIGFRAVNNSIMTYVQTKKGFNFFYPKRKVLSNGIDTVPLTMTLNPWEDYNAFVLRAEKHCMSNDYQCALQKHGHIYRSCTQLFMYEMAIYNDHPQIAADILKARNDRKMMAVSKCIKPKQSWYTDRDDIMHQIVWQKINNIKMRVILELRECGQRLIVQPGYRSNNYFTCGLSQKMAEITKPSQFPGSDMMSVFWDNLKADHQFMNSW